MTIQNKNILQQKIDYLIQFLQKVVVPPRTIQFTVPPNYKIL